MLPAGLRNWYIASQPEAADPKKKLSYQYRMGFFFHHLHSSLLIPPVPAESVLAPLIY